MKGITKEKKIIITVLIVAVLMLTVAFASLSSVLKINGTAKVDSALWDIHFKSASMISKKGDAREAQEPVIENGGIDLTLNVGLRKPKDEITYEAVIVNAGDMDAQIERIDYPELSEDQAKILAFEATYDTGMMLIENQSLKAKEEIKVIITIRFKDITDESLLKTEAYDIPLTFKINYIQSGLGTPAIDRNTESILAMGDTGGGTSKFFGGPITKESVEKIKFMPTTNASSDAIDSWDASYKKDNSVIAWYTDDDSNDLYELYIGGYVKVYTPENSASLFQNFTKVTEIDFGNVFDTSKATTMAYMFDKCTSLISLDLSTFNTNSVTTMFDIFRDCSSLTSVNISSFNTENVTTMEGMFLRCSSLTSLNISHFNAEKVTSMARMFNEASSLTTLKMNDLNAVNLINIYLIFVGCTNLKELDISDLNATSLTSITNMFAGLSKLEKVNISNSGTTNVTNMASLFEGCSSLREINLTNFKTVNVINMSKMFYNCSRLQSVDVSGFNTSNVTNMSYMFDKCTSLISLDLSTFNTNSVTTMFDMFRDCSSLTSVNISSFNTENVTTMEGMFLRCSSLTSLDISQFNVEKVTTMYKMFQNCSSLINLNLKNVYFTNAINTVYMLSGVPSSINIIVGSQSAKDFLLGVRSDLTNILVEV